MTLAQSVIGTDSALKKLAIVIGGSLLIAIAANIRIPLEPVPVTLQTLAILFIALSVGPRLAVATVLVYLAEGFAGLPVFAKFAAGPAYFAGPTAGFLLGFVIMAFIAGLAAGRGLLTMIFAGLVATTVNYLPGLAWPMAVASTFGIDASWVGSDWATIWQYWLSPFIAADTVKAVIAAMLVMGGAALFGKRG